MKKMTLFSLVLLVSLFSLFFMSTGALAEEVVIGFTGPLSGPAAQYGRDNVAGLEMAVADLNKAGGIKVAGKKYSFKLVTYDDHVDPTAAVNNARRLVSRDKAKVIFNPVFSTLAPLTAINEQRGSEFLLMAYTSTPALDQIKNKLTIAIPPPFVAYLEAYMEYAWEKGWRKGAMVVTLGAYGDEWRQAFKKSWIEKGGEILADQPANYYTETDFSSHLAAALATKPDFLLIGGPSDPTALVIEQARNLGFQGGFILVDQAKMNYIADVAFKGDLSKMNNLVGVARTLDIGPKHIMQPFIERYSKEYSGRVATSENVLNYSAMRMLAAAMEKAGTVSDLPSIKAALPTILPMDPKVNLVAYMGMLETRFLVPGTVQSIENDQYQTSIQNVWWPKNKEEFEEVVKQIPEREVISKYLPLEGYSK